MIENGRDARGADPCRLLTDDQLARTAAGRAGRRPARPRRVRAASGAAQRRRARADPATPAAAGIGDVGPQQRAHHPPGAGRRLPGAGDLHRPRRVLPVRRRGRRRPGADARAWTAPRPTRARPCRPWSLPMVIGRTCPPSRAVVTASAARAGPRWSSARAHGAADAVRSYADDPRTRQRLAGQLERLDEPLRIAIAGKVKAGKSTLLNALVGEQVAADGRGGVHPDRHLVPRRAGAPDHDPPRGPDRPVALPVRPP